MVRKESRQPAGPHAVYRHFAIFTIAVTLVVGVFADGESRQASASEVARPARTASPAPVSKALIRKDQPVRGSFASDDAFDGTFGAPMDSAGALAHDGVVAGQGTDEADSGVPSAFNRYGVSADAWAGLTPEQKKALIARRDAQLKAAAAPERTDQIDRLLAASQARAGTATTAD